MEYSIKPGSPHPLGATVDDAGVNFAVYSERGLEVAVCLYDQAYSHREVARLTLPGRTTHVWHGRVDGLKGGALYGFRASGPYDPKKGLYFNAQKLLVDPYARAVHGFIDWKNQEPDSQDDAAAVPKSVVIQDTFDWKGDIRPNIPLYKTFIYELHVKGFTHLHPAISPEQRGTYAGLGSAPAIEHLKKLGVTAVELLPVHERGDEGFLSDRGLSNYWGYNTLAFFAPDQRFSSRGSKGGQVDDFKEMVRLLHEAGIEVILDVVYNHSCEGNHLGPLLSLRGLDNPVYYRLKEDDPSQYADFTGTGNSINSFHPQTLKLICDSLRYWVEVMHVDGFRFDLATTLGRRQHDYEREAAFFQAIHQDPVLSRVKLIAEPWDVGPGGYQVGNFPILWSEWNDRYRNNIRRFWRGDEHIIADVGYRLTGSSDLFQLSGRGPTASINFIAVHDGYTLDDLVTYERKHNEANKEDNRDGSDENFSWNCGHEGETEDQGIISLRDRQKRNFLATLFVSQGVPMLCAGDEAGRTQRGNNNAYCQDNEISWYNWNWDKRASELFDFTCHLSRLRRDHPVLRRRRFFQGQHFWDSQFKDLAWFRPDGKEMTEADWSQPDVRSIAFLIGGDAIPTPDRAGNRVLDDSLLILMNAETTPVLYTLPAIEWGAEWRVLLDTAKPNGPERNSTPAGSKFEAAARALIVLSQPQVT